MRTRRRWSLKETSGMHYEPRFGLVISSVASHAEVRTADAQGILQGFSLFESGA